VSEAGASGGPLADARGSGARPARAPRVPFLASGARRVYHRRVGGSGNLALYQLLVEEGEIPQFKLDEALKAAHRGRIPLEDLLLRQREVEVEELAQLLEARSARARTCAACGETTFLLKGQFVERTPCEHCGGRLETGNAGRLTRSQEAVRRADARPRPGSDGAARTRVARPPADRSSRLSRRLGGPHPPGPERSGAAARPPAGVAPTASSPERRPSGPSPRSPAALAADVRRAVDAYLAKRGADPAVEAVGKEVAEQARLTRELGARVEELARQAPADGSEQVVAEALARVRREFDVGTLSKRIVREVIQEVDRHVHDVVGRVETEAGLAVERRLQADDVRGLGDRVARQALAATQQRLDQLDLPALPDRVGRLALTAVEDHLRAEAADLPQEARQAALEAVERRLAAEGLDALPERVARWASARAMEAVEDRLADQERRGPRGSPYAAGGAAAAPAGRPLRRAVGRQLGAAVAAFAGVLVLGAAGRALLPPVYTARAVVVPAGAAAIYPGPARRLAAAATTPEALVATAREVGLAPRAGLAEQLMGLPPDPAERLGATVRIEGAAGRAEQLVVGARGTSTAQAEAAAGRLADAVVAAAAPLDAGAEAGLEVVGAPTITARALPWGVWGRWLVAAAAATALAVAVVRELRRDGFADAREVEDALGLPVVAELAAVGGRR